MRRSNSKYIILLIAMLPGCSKFVTVDPPSTQLVTATVFTSDATATATVIGIYSNMMNANLGFYGGALTLNCGLSADEFQNYSFSTDQSEFVANSLQSANLIIKQLWSQGYQYIYAANAVLEGLTHSNGISAAAIQELTGETKFIRAFTYFYLVNLWGKVPLVLTTNYATNDTVHRADVSTVYLQIVQDLRDAQLLLKPDYSAGGGERIRPNQSAATALLARVLLYMHDWQGAVEQSTDVISKSDLYSLSGDLTQVFLANSTEAIWQLHPVAPDVNTWEGNYFILTGGTSSSPGQITISQSLLESFEAGDQRILFWINIDNSEGQNNYYPFKYKIRTGSPVTEYEMVLRLAEQFLIRAEAEANLDNTAGAIADLNIVRRRAGLPDLTASLNSSQCLNAVAQERKIELFAEWGHRWLDLKRTDQANAVLTPVKSGWQASDTLYPIPRSEIQNDPNLSQNPGY